MAKIDLVDKIRVVVLKTPRSTCLLFCYCIIFEYEKHNLFKKLLKQKNHSDLQHYSFNNLFNKKAKSIYYLILKSFVYGNDIVIVCIN